MKLKLFYNGTSPSLQEYNVLLRKMKQMSMDYFYLDKMLNSDYSIDLMITYENKKRELILKMFKEILSCFSILNSIPCAIYLNGSFARRSLTSGSDVDLTFYFNEEDISKYQSLIYLVRNAIANMLNVSTMHVHSFTKNFTTEFRKMNNLVVTDQSLTTEIIWPSNEKYVIEYPINQMAAEREICEISSIKNIKSLEELYVNQLKKIHPKEWVYTHELIFCSDKSFSIENLIIKLDLMYSKVEIKKVLLNIKEELDLLLKEIIDYYTKLETEKQIDLASFNMIGKRKVAMMFYSFMTYIRWYYIYNGKTNVPVTLDLVSFFNYKSDLIDSKVLNDINKDYYYFRFLISRIEIWVKKYNHHFEHRSMEVIDKDVLCKEYSELWKTKYSPIDEQKRIVMQLNNKINIILKEYCNN